MKHLIPLTTICTLLLSIGLKAQSPATENPDSLDSLSLEQLMDVKVTIATLSEQSARETPGIVSVLTRKDIEKLQAIDLVDVLRWVPGLEIAHDVEMALSISVRGLWGQEGKVLLIIDGHEMQETAYGGYQLAGRYPSSTIERIEIIRGPGSVAYGGNAALSVINITTSSAEKSPLIQVNAQGRINADGISRSRLNAESAFQYRNFRLKAFLSASQSRYGTGNIVLSGESGRDSITKNLSESAGTRDLMAGVHLNWKKWDLKWLGNQYEHPSYRKVTYQQNMHSLLLSNTWNINERLELKSQANYKYATPWNVAKDSANEYLDNVRNFRLGFRTILRYQAPKHLELTAGAEVYHDDQDFINLNPLDPNRPIHFMLQNLSVFSQALYKSVIGTFTAGARLDENSFFGTFFVPRFGYTKIFGPWHLKLLYSNAYRTPSLYNLKIFPETRPEFLETVETEIGYLSKNHRVSVNMYLNNLYDPVIYTQTSGGFDTYRNDTRIGSKGIELDYYGQYEQWNWAFNYAYTLPHENRIELFSLINNPNNFVAFSKHRINARLNIPVISGWSIQLTQQFWSERFSQNPGLVPIKIEAQWVSGLMFSKKWSQSGWMLQAGVNDLFNTRLSTIQAFSGYISPFRSLGRELVLSFTKSLDRL